jgi:8-oxo-dGTP diphosphatase
MTNGCEHTPDVVKVGLALVVDRRLLLVRRHNDPWLILPGGKPIANESDEETLARECREELSCAIDRDSVHWLGEFTDELVDDAMRQVVVRLYSAALVGKPTPSAEIEELSWHSLDGASSEHLAPSLRRQIIPRLAGLSSPEPGNR